MCTYFLQHVGRYTIVSSQLGITLESSTSVIHNDGHSSLFFGF